MVRCTDCKKEIIKDTEYMDWLAIVHYIEFEYMNDEITITLYESLMDRLQTIKPIMED